MKEGDLKKMTQRNQFRKQKFAKRRLYHQFGVITKKLGTSR